MIYSICGAIKYSGLRGAKMFIVFFICWVIFNQSFTLEIALFGVAISAVMYLFVCKFFDYSPKKDLLILKKLPLMLEYVLILIVEILKANLTLYKLFFTVRKKDRHPVIVTFRTKLRTRTAKVFLANAITLTPGTITVSVKGNEFKIHCYDSSLAVELDDLIFEKKLLKLEEGFEE